MQFKDLEIGKKFIEMPISGGLDVTQTYSIYIRIPDRWIWYSENHKLIRNAVRSNDGALWTMSPKVQVIRVV